MCDGCPTKSSCSIPVQKCMKCVLEKIFEFFKNKCMGVQKMFPGSSPIPVQKCMTTFQKECIM